MSRHRPGRTRAVLAALVAAVLCQSGVTAAPAQASWLPDGRANYVISMMDGRADARSVRLATYTFATNGTVTERYWAWRQDSVTGDGNARWTKPPSGYTTQGCLHACPIRTPTGFQKGATPRLGTGRWSMTAPDQLQIRWTANSAIERWHLDASQPGIVGATLASGGADARGWGVGSNARPDRGVPLSSIYASGDWITGPFAENAYATANLYSSIGWSAADYTLCSTGRCMQGRSVTAPDKRTWYSSYFAANSAVDGRKVYWNNQTGVVQQMEAPGSVCISASGGGHTNALLQALDDDGRFVGFVGVEASINQRKIGQDVVAAYTMILPWLQPAIGRT
jgi:hypothetical protein